MEISNQVESVFDGEQAVERMKKSPSDFDLIYLDWEMPKKTGPETFDEFKALGIKTPVIMLTSKNGSENIVQMLSAGVAEYIMKPFTKEILIEKIQSILG